MAMKSIGAMVMGGMVLLSGCSDSNVSNENLGRLGGGIAGAYIGSASSDSNVAPVVGAVVGSYIGGELGRNKDKENEEKAASVLNSSLAKASTQWTNTKDNAKYTMSVTQKYSNNGKTCRPYTIKKAQNGAMSSKNGIACVEGDTWRLA